VGDYVIRHAYSNGADLAFQAGQEVELDDETAAWLQVDSPGVITPVDGPAPKKAEAEAEAAEPAEDAKPKRARAKG